MDTVDSEHMKIFNYIADSDLDSATRILRQHISNVKEYAIASIKKINREKSIKTI